MTFIQITSIAELDELPVGSVVRNDMGCVLEKTWQGDLFSDWRCTKHFDRDLGTKDVAHFPALLLYRGGTAHYPTREENP